MLDRYKLLDQLDQMSKNIFQNFAKEQDIAASVWAFIRDDKQICDKIRAKHYSLLLPDWQGSLGISYNIKHPISEYAVLAVDGSQIYYDKHQGPACYLLNIGSVFFDYCLQESSVSLLTHPYVYMISEKLHGGSVDFVNLQREAYEFEHAWNIVQKYQQNKPFLTLIDGSLIFFHVDSLGQEQKQEFFKIYIDYLYKFYNQQRYIIGYMSFPRTKELVNILKVVLAQFDEIELKKHHYFEQLTDMDIAALYVQDGYRSIVFKSKAPISYAYPAELKPYFCYLNVGYEIVRLEFPAWIAQQNDLVNHMCQIVYDQAQKGRGYPVCLFEAHEQAVIKNYDRTFFYAIIQKKIQQYNSRAYCKSLKSIKKEIVPV